MDRGGRWLGRVVAFGVATALMVLAAPPAWSHSELDRSDPPNGGMVAPGRSSLTLWFGEPVSPSASRFVLRSLAGHRVAVSIRASAGGDLIRLTTDPLPIDTYQLDWRILSLDDGHSSSGTLVFGAGLRPNVVPAGGGGLPALPVLIARWLELTAVLLAIGALVVSGRVLGSLGAVCVGPRQRTRRIGLAAVVAAALAGILSPLARTYSNGTSPDVWLAQAWATLTGTPWGQLWLARELAIVLAVAAVWSWARGGRNPTRAGRLALAGLCVAILLESFSGHASALARMSWAAALASTAHVLAAGVWAGGLFVLVVCLVPLMRRNPDLRGVVLSSVWRTYSPMAAVASLVLLATGLYQAGRHLPDLGSTVSTVYGAAVTGKSALVLGALAMAGLNLLLVNPSISGRAARVLRRAPGWTPLPRERFTRLVTVEALFLLVAVGLAALLTSVPSAREVVEARQVTSPHSANVDGLFITFESVPAGLERTRLIARVRSTILPPPAEVRGADIELAGPAGAARQLALAQVEEGRFEAETRAPGPGRWTATVRVHRPGLPDTIMSAAWTVTAPAGARATALERVSTALAGLLLLGGLTAVVLTRRRRRGFPPNVSAPVTKQEASVR